MSLRVGAWATENTQDFFARKKLNLRMENSVNVWRQMNINVFFEATPPWGEDKHWIFLLFSLFWSGDMPECQRENEFGDCGLSWDDLKHGRVAEISHLLSHYEISANIVVDAVKRSSKMITYFVLFPGDSMSVWLAHSWECRMLYKPALAVELGGIWNGASARKVSFFAVVRVVSCMFALYSLAYLRKVVEN